MHDCRKNTYVLVAEKSYIGRNRDSNEQSHFKRMGYVSLASIYEESSTSVDWLNLVACCGSLDKCKSDR